MQSLRDKLEQVELQIRHLIEEAEAKSQHLKTEKKKIEEEKKKNEEVSAFGELGNENIFILTHKVLHFEKHGTE